MKRLSWKYVAGLIDGEGCIDVAITHGTYISPRVRVALSAAGLDVITLLHNSYGGTVQKRTSKNPAWQDSYSWELVGYKDVCMFLRNIVNHLIIKQQQARFILWMETGIKGQKVSAEARDSVREELKLQKRDPHRLSEKGQELILGML
jgi:hypothetical protein